MRHYIALIRKEKGTCYGVDFPDFPGCITAAESVGEAQARAVEALDLHVDGMVEDGEPLPMTTGLDQILEEDVDGFVMAVQVPLTDKKSKKVRVDITIPEDLSLQIDRHVKCTVGLNRSSFFAEAGLEKMQRVTIHREGISFESGKGVIKRAGTFTVRKAGKVGVALPPGVRIKKGKVVRKFTKGTKKSTKARA